MQNALGGDVYVDFAKRCVERYGGSGDDWDLQRLVAACAMSYADSKCGKGGVCGVGERVVEGDWVSRLLQLRGSGNGAVGLGSTDECVGSSGGATSDVRGNVGVGGDAGLLVENDDVVPEWRKNAAAVGGLSRGKHYEKNRRKRLARRVVKSRGYDSSGCVSSSSDCGTVKTVDSRTAVEIAAAESLAARRVAENQVATELAKHKLNALRDKDRTDAVNRLAAVRYEQRINDARARSQASYKKCDESLKSLGSSGSAGEFALKQEVKRAKDNEVLRHYVEAQLKLALKYASSDVHQMIAAMPPPVLQDEFEAFGECPSEYDEEEQQAYFDDLNRRNEENFDKCATYC